MGVKLPMKCINCPFFRKKDNVCIKMKEGQMSELEGDCLLRYISNQLSGIADFIMEGFEDEDNEGEGWKNGG